MAEQRVPSREEIETVIRGVIVPAGEGAASDQSLLEVGHIESCQVAGGRIRLTLAVPSSLAQPLEKALQELSWRWTGPFRNGARACC